MKKLRLTDEQIAFVLRQAEAWHHFLHLADSLVWAVGTPLGADYPIYIHASDNGEDYIGAIGETL